SAKRRRKAAHWGEDFWVPETVPTRNIFLADCCARAASGHAAAAPRSVMSSRRFTVQCLRASTEKDSTTGGSAALLDFDQAYALFWSGSAINRLLRTVLFAPQSGYSFLTL